MPGPFTLDPEHSMRVPVSQFHRRSRSVVLAAAVLLSAGVFAEAQIPVARPGQFGLDSATAQDRIDFRAAITFIRAQVVGVAEAMPADKYRFAPTAGEFHGVRTFGQQIKHLAATNYILAAAALGQAPPADAGDEAGPDSVHTKAQHLAYLAGSFEALDRAAAAIGDRSVPVKSSPISPFQGGSATRLALVAEALIHTNDHYGQLVVYLRMNGIVPPASR
ncbi:MAG TPA: DinB family protein [Casimicrobiaceae bacterium]|nr:DinB family protein [Casimicrobiaceae bacterium]